MGIVDFGHAKTIAVTGVHLPAFGKDFLVNRDGLAILDGHFGGHGALFGEFGELAHGFIEDDGDDAAVSEALMTRQIAGTLNLQVAWLPQSLGRYPVAFGLWKGDLTLKRRLIDIIEALNREGFSHDLARKYQIAPIALTLGGA